MTDAPLEAPAPDPDQYICTEVRDGTGMIVLDRPKALNALTASMYHELRSTLLAWRDDRAVSQVLISSSSEKAFCAGGDIRQIRTAMVEGQQEQGRAALREEYSLDALVAGYPKPYAALMDGYTMGGGMGISVHGSHRIVTERTVMAMPEAAIGFFPDVGASWFLPRVSLLGRGPSLGVGRWMALTGARISGADAIAIGLADYMVPSSRLMGFQESVVRIGVQAALAEYAVAPGQAGMPQAELPERWDEIERIYGQDTLGQVLAAAPAEELDGAPSSLVRTWELLERGVEAQSLTECLERELAMAWDAIAAPDFAEGVRAVLIDKGDEPQWSPGTVAEVDVEAIAAVADRREPLL